LPVVRSIKIWHTLNNIVGVEFKYRTNEDKKIDGAKYLGSFKEDVKDLTLELDKDEWILEISGTGDQIVESLMILTSKGKCLTVGGQGKANRQLLGSKKGVDTKGCETGKTQQTCQTGGFNQPIPQSGLNQPSSGLNQPTSGISQPTTNPMVITQVVGMGCATNGHLHNIYFYFVWEAWVVKRYI